jgi:hypothetical protein
MKQSISRIELAIICAFVALFAVIVLRNWGHFFAIQGIAIAGILLLVSCLLLLLFVRRHGNGE